MTTSDLFCKWKEGASLALVLHLTSECITLKIPYGVYILLHWPALHHPSSTYSRPILCSTIECYPLLQKLYKALFWCKTLRKGIEQRGEIFGALFSEKVPFFLKKKPFLANIECCPKFLEYALPSFPIGLVKTKSDCIARSVETGLGR